ncbi:MAG: glycoside hydrolase family 43 protein [Clostridiales bacterium]|jgi:hypothetical protein|nr:glycoside hydrolase family 43 protein [Clostridiales bacterium]
MPSISEIQIRDPFVFADGGTFYLFGTTDSNPWGPPATGFDAYRCVDGGLAEFEGPFPVFRPPGGFWSRSEFWAPEVYRYGGEHYMFATFNPVSGRRGTAVLKSATPSVLGPYEPWSDGPVTPRGWECLDGTLFVEGGEPFMVFCHEWVQIGDGEIAAIPLARDLKAAAGDAEALFKSSDAPWSKPRKYRKALPPDPPGWLLAGGAPEFYVTDGPNFHRTGDGTLVLLWSAFGEGERYCIGASVSESGALRGPWRHSREPLYSADGGHGMVFRSARGKLCLAIHTPNGTPDERAAFIELEERGGSLALA